jgi:hypothetical protein
VLCAQSGTESGNAFTEFLAIELLAVAVCALDGYGTAVTYRRPEEVLSM